MLDGQLKPLPTEDSLQRRKKISKVLRPNNVLLFPE